MALINSQNRNLALHHAHCAQNTAVSAENQKQVRIQILERHALVAKFCRNRLLIDHRVSHIHQPPAKRLGKLQRLFGINF